VLTLDNVVLQLPQEYGIDTNGQIFQGQTCHLRWDNLSMVGGIPGPLKGTRGEAVVLQMALCYYDFTVNNRSP